ncbi:MAG: FkbM family methyltransferase [Candidatus Bathyarchaeia archaeon]
MVVRSSVSAVFTQQMESGMNELIRNVRVKIDGVTYVLVDSESFGIVLPEHEGWMPNYLDVHENEVFLDIGAHVGKYALRIAKRVNNSKVVAVEANPLNFRALQAGVELNGLKNVAAMNLAAWSSKERRKLYLATVGGQHSLKENVNLGYIIVEAEPLDQTLKRIGTDTVDWIKIDVEDAENEVLCGLRETIRRCKPHIVFESKTDELLKQSQTFLECYGYRVETIAFDNYIAIPISREP